MILLYNELQRIEADMNLLLETRVIEDFRIYLKSNNSIVIYVIADDLPEAIYQKYDDSKISIEAFSTKTDDEFIKNLYFSRDEKINTVDSDRRMGNLLENNRLLLKEEQLNTPVITFYSYKGGVGRSTTLASCASYLSTHYSKKIVIIDCDFEAPGFTNFYLSDSGEPFYNNGVVEYLFDHEFESKETNVRNYVWEASKDYSGNGSIFIMPSGNLNDFQAGPTDIVDRDHYLKGLARLDFSERENIILRFQNMLKKIETEIKPDLFLLDSRTGFNDIFGLTAFQLSDAVVGFFGNNVQTLPGIHFFIDSIIKRQYLVGIIVNSIIPASNRRRWFSSFKDNVDSYLSDRLSTYQDREQNASEVNIDVFSITRNEILEAVGNKDGDRLDFIDLIRDKLFPDQIDLFEKINSLLIDLPFEKKGNVDVVSTEMLNAFSNQDEEADLSDDEACTETEIKEETQSNNSHPTTGEEVYGVKMRVLNTLQEKMPELYAEDIEDYEKEFKEGRYFYRNCMLDLFNLDKFIVLGNKGTGKTYIYRSLDNDNIVKELQNRANKSDIDYKFIHIILKNRYFIDITKFEGLEKYSNEKYYERFWQVYIWNVLSQELQISNEKDLELKPFPILDNIQTSLEFDRIISNDLLMVRVEMELEAIDKNLKDHGNTNIIIIFDELDHVVKPYQWSDKVAPLINLCKRFTYTRIFPKLFLRSDLFVKIANVNNIQALNNRSINIEWNREELFAYFFKLILSNSKEDFFYLMRAYDDFPTNYIARVRREIDKEEKQPKTDEYTLKHLTATFFGKYADVSNTPRFGESYDWFYRNLKNANDTISLRPFIDLLSESVMWAISEDKSAKPILPQYYYTHGQARGNAVKRHFQDLAKEKGNADLEIIFKYIRDDAESKHKLLELQQSDFYSLLDGVIRKYSDSLENRTKEDLIELLKVNGIIVDRFQRSGARNNVQKRYQFALLYKYYLGLKNRVR